MISLKKLLQFGLIFFKVFYRLTRVCVIVHELNCHSGSVNIFIS